VDVYADVYTLLSKRLSRPLGLRAQTPGADQGLSLLYALAQKDAAMLQYGYVLFQ
jgi:hypothetical protein